MARLFLATLIALVTAAGLSAGPQQNVPLRAPAADPSDQEPFPDRATLAATKRTVDNRPLFTSTDVLVFSLVADFGQVQRDRTPDGEKMYPASVVVMEKGKEVSIPAKIRTRGHSRLKPDFCTFAPLRVEFDANPVGTVFEGQKKLKLGVHCRDSGQYPDYVVREYPVYRMFNVLTPRSFRARLAEAHYVDAKNGKTINVRGALFLEDDDDVARRMEGRISDTTGLRYRGRVDAETSTLVTLFEYMIGNTDLSIRSLHNMRIVLTPGGTRYPVPYDFDFAGVVNAIYAGPSPMLRSIITDVRDRLYLGPCRTPEELENTFKHFRAKRAELMAVYDTAPMLKPNYVASAKKYLDQFFTLIDRPDRVKKAFIDNCETRPYM